MIEIKEVKEVIETSSREQILAMKSEITKASKMKAFPQVRLVGFLRGKMFRQTMLEQHLEEANQMRQL